MEKVKRKRSKRNQKTFNRNASNSKMTSKPKVSTSMYSAPDIQRMMQLLDIESRPIVDTVKFDLSVNSIRRDFMYFRDFSGLEPWSNNENTSMFHFPKPGAVRLPKLKKKKTTKTRTKKLRLPRKARLPPWKSVVTSCHNEKAFRRLAYSFSQDERFSNTKPAVVPKKTTTSERNNCCSPNMGVNRKSRGIWSSNDWLDSVDIPSRTRTPSESISQDVKITPSPYAKESMTKTEHSSIRKESRERHEQRVQDTLNPVFDYSDTEESDDEELDLHTEINTETTIELERKLETPSSRVSPQDVTPPGSSVTSDCSIHAMHPVQSRTNWDKSNIRPFVLSKVLPRLSRGNKDIFGRSLIIDDPGDESEVTERLSCCHSHQHKDDFNILQKQLEAYVNSNRKTEAAHSKNRFLSATNQGSSLSVFDKLKLDNMILSRLYLNKRSGFLSRPGASMRDKYLSDSRSFNIKQCKMSTSRGRAKTCRTGQKNGEDIRIIRMYDHYETFKDDLQRFNLAENLTKEQKPYRCNAHSSAESSFRFDCRRNASENDLRLCDDNILCHLLEDKTQKQGGAVTPASSVSGHCPVPSPVLGQPANVSHDFDHNSHSSRTSARGQCGASMRKQNQKLRGENQGSFDAFKDNGNVRISKSEPTLLYRSNPTKISKCQCNPVDTHATELCCELSEGKNNITLDPQFNTRPDQGRFWNVPHPKDKVLSDGVKQWKMIMQSHKLEGANWSEEKLLLPFYKGRVSPTPGVSASSCNLKRDNFRLCTFNPSINHNFSSERMVGQKKTAPLEKNKRASENGTRGLTRHIRSPDMSTFSIKTNWKHVQSRYNEIKYKQDTMINKPRKRRVAFQPLQPTRFELPNNLDKDMYAPSFYPSRRKCIRRRSHRRLNTAVPDSQGECNVEGDIKPKWDQRLEQDQYDPDALPKHQYGINAEQQPTTNNGFSVVVGDEAFGDFKYPSFKEAFITKLRQANYVAPPSNSSHCQAPCLPTVCGNTILLKSQKETDICQNQKQSSDLNTHLTVPQPSNDCIRDAADHVVTASDLTLVSQESIQDFGNNNTLVSDLSSENVTSEASDAAITDLNPFQSDQNLPSVSLSQTSKDGVKVSQINEISPGNYKSDIQAYDLTKVSDEAIQMFENTIISESELSSEHSASEDFDQTINDLKLSQHDANIQSVSHSPTSENEAHQNNEINIDNQGHVQLQPTLSFIRDIQLCDTDSNSDDEAYTDNDEETVLEKQDSLSCLPLDNDTNLDPSESPDLEKSLEDEKTKWNEPSFPPVYFADAVTKRKTTFPTVYFSVPTEGNVIQMESTSDPMTFNPIPVRKPSFGDSTLPSIDDSSYAVSHPPLSLPEVPKKPSKVKRGKFGKDKQDEPAFKRKQDLSAKKDKNFDRSKPKQTNVSRTQHRKYTESSCDVGGVSTSMEMRYTNRQSYPARRIVLQPFSPEERQRQAADIPSLSVPEHRQLQSPVTLPPLNGHYGNTSGKQLYKKTNRRIPPTLSRWHRANSDLWYPERSVDLDQFPATDVLRGLHAKTLALHKQANSSLPKELMTSKLY